MNLLEERLAELYKRARKIRAKLDTTPVYVSEPVQPKKSPSRKRDTALRKVNTSFRKTPEVPKVYPWEYRNHPVKRSPEEEAYSMQPSSSRQSSVINWRPIVGLGTLVAAAIGVVSFLNSSQPPLRTNQSESTPYVATQTYSPPAPVVNVDEQTQQRFAKYFTVECDRGFMSRNFGNAKVGYDSKASISCPVLARVTSENDLDDSDFRSVRANALKDASKADEVDSIAHYDVWRDHNRLNGLSITNFFTDICSTDLQQKFRFRVQNEDRKGVAWSGKDEFIISNVAGPDFSACLRAAFFIDPATASPKARQTLASYTPYMRRFKEHLFGQKALAEVPNYPYVTSEVNR